MNHGVVSTRHGKVRGREEDGCWVFRGIRYARAPRGELRFRAPLVPEPWAGVRDAFEFGPIAPQPRSGLGSYVPGDPLEQDEDCLALNLWTPGTDTRRRPVLCFLHGGAFLTQSGSGVMYRGSSLARRGVVVVTINYRLGALGFLAHPALLDGPGSGFGNWGLADQLAALRWLRDNVSGFGGDPDNVTVLGESAGAMSVCDLLGAPSARGLFRRAIAESGAVLASSPAATASVAEQLAAELGLAGLSRPALVSVPTDELVEAQGRVGALVDEGIGLPFQPVVDGGLLDIHPARAIALGRGAGVDLLIGTNRDEFRFFSFALEGFSQLDERRLHAIVERYLAGSGLPLERLDAEGVVSLYREARRARAQEVGSPELLVAIATDWIFRIPAMRLASVRAAFGARSFAYRFDGESPFAGGALGACHGIELPFVFGTFEDEFVGLFSGQGSSAALLSERVQAAWVAFASTGDPTCPEVGPWPEYEPARRATMVFGAETRCEDAPGEEERRFFDERLGRYGVDGPIEGVRPPGVALLAPDDERGELTGT